MFGFFTSLFNRVTSVFSGIGNKLSDIFSSKTDFETSLEKVRELFYQNDVSVVLADEIVEHLKKTPSLKTKHDLESVKSEIFNFLNLILSQTNADGEVDKQKPAIAPEITILVGVNGVGKTTFAVKLANMFKKNKNNPLLVAADTFRAAAVQQLKIMSKNANLDLVLSETLSDPSSVIYEAGVQFSNGKHSRLIIDTAGRLHTKVNLINEFKKMQKVLEKTNLSNKHSQTLLVLDGMLGQANIAQAKIFCESIKIDGIVITKLDSASRCGSILSIVREFKLPVVYMSSGNDLDSICTFDSKEFLTRFLS